MKGLNIVFDHNTKKLYDSLYGNLPEKERSAAAEELGNWVANVLSKTLQDASDDGDDEHVFDTSKLIEAAINVSKTPQQLVVSLFKIGQIAEQASNPMNGMMGMGMMMPMMGGSGMMDMLKDMMKHSGEEHDHDDIHEAHAHSHSGPEHAFLGDEEFNAWKRRGNEIDAKAIIITYDKMEKVNYPIYVLKTESVQAREEELGADVNINVLKTINL